MRYMFGGKAKIPLVVRTVHGAGASAAAQHSQSLYNMFATIPGVKVVVPSNPYDAKGLLMSAIQDDNLVVFSEDKTLLGQKVMCLKNLIQLRLVKPMSHEKVMI